MGRENNQQQAANYIRRKPVGSNKTENIDSLTELRNMYRILHLDILLHF